MTVPARHPRLIATDLDGTLLRPDGSVSDRTRRALSGLADVGIELVFATARPPRWVDHLADVAGAHGTVLCVNGAFVYDVPASPGTPSTTAMPAARGKFAETLILAGLAGSIGTVGDAYDKGWASYCTSLVVLMLGRLGRPRIGCGQPAVCGS